MKFGYYKVIISGTRTFTNYAIMKKYADFYLKDMKRSKTMIVSGLAPGPDTFAVWYAEFEKYELRKFPAMWKEYGKKAGPVRNEEMALFSTHLIAFWDYESDGTKDMIERAEKHKLEVRVIDIRRYIS